MRKAIVAAVAFGLLAFSASAQDKLSVKGSDTINAKLLPRLADAYEAAGNAITFEIEDKGSSSAFTNLAAGTADIGCSSREVDESEREKFTAKGQELMEFVAAIDMIGVVVNEKNRVDELSIEQVEGIFTGEITDWSEVGGKPGKINAYTRNETSGTYASFQEMAMSGRDYGADTQKMEGNEQIATEVAEDVNGIGYVGKAYVGKEGLKTVAIDGVAFDEKNKTSYGIARKLYYYTIGAPKGAAAEFLLWAMHSPVAAEIVSDTGFIPAN